MLLEKFRKHVTAGNENLGVGFRKGEHRNLPWCMPESENE
jgi:hypothetical protein